MKLAAYLRKYSIRPAEFARRIGKSRSFISLILSGKRLPSARTVVDIEIATGGKVGFRDFHR